MDIDIGYFVPIFLTSDKLDPNFRKTGVIEGFNKESYFGYHFFKIYYTLTRLPMSNFVKFRYVVCEEVCEQTNRQI
jgi:hypothetical protein